MNRLVWSRTLGISFALLALGACDDTSNAVDASASKEVECEKGIAAASPGGIVMGLLGCKKQPRDDLDCLPERLHETAHVEGGRDRFCVDGQPTDAALRLGFVSRAIFEAAGKKWPLSVDDGFVGCTGTGARWFVARDGRLYGLNGLASRSSGYHDIKPIWSENDEFNQRMTRENGEPPATPSRISIFDLSQAAAEHCS